MPGQTLTVPLDFEQTDREAIELGSFDLVLGYDQTVFEVRDVRSGSLTEGFGITWAADPDHGPNPRRRSLDPCRPAPAGGNAGPWSFWNWVVRSGGEDRRVSAEHHVDRRRGGSRRGRDLPERRGPGACAGSDRTKTTTRSTAWSRSARCRRRQSARHSGPGLRWTGRSTPLARRDVPPAGVPASASAIAISPAESPAVAASSSRRSAWFRRSSIAARWGKVGSRWP